MMKVALVAVLLSPPARDPWFGPDKVKHFFVSAFVHSGAFSAMRAARVSHSNAQAIAGVTSISIGVGRETYDRRRGRPFSFKDLAWDAAGIVAAAALLNGTR
jgi:uncharacterized protein YfiM (DUF2279 family)